MKWNSWGLKLYAFHKFHIVDLFYSFWISWMARKIKGERIRIECGWSQPGARYKEGHLMIIRFHNATWCLCLLCHLVHFFFLISSQDGYLAVVFCLAILRTLAETSSIPYARSVEPMKWFVDSVKCCNCIPFIFIACRYTKLYMPFRYIYYAMINHLSD